MTPQQVQGLWLCLTLSFSFALLVPALWWMLPDRRATM
ncbi:hypothetical protein XM38_025990 [Halomicronema hongdechloris C2206]|uniref:Uncharacterized protein n=1 Tax=Halomicronema hongdechloris C2206 TaxID=1641165 RepID=A0A1Z3HMZ0_9CYAN|nr:hypothetical protein XM38_025990 [Halomicronema hongdechloris C2206]